MSVSYLLLLLRLFQPTVSVLYVVSPDQSSEGWIQKLCFLCSTAPAAHALCGEWAQFPKCAWVKRSTEKTGNFQGKKNACEHAWDLNGHWWIMTMQSLIKVNVFHSLISYRSPVSSCFLPPQLLLKVVQAGSGKHVSICKGSQVCDLRNKTATRKIHGTNKSSVLLLYTHCVICIWTSACEF